MTRNAGNDAPVRLCCGQRHHGPVCPADGMVMCCICFERRAIEQLHVLEDGTREDVCKACAEYEARIVPPAEEQPR